MAIKKNEKKSLIILLLAYLMIIIIFGNSLLPADLSSNQSGFFTHLIKDMLAFFDLNVQVDLISFFVRKLAHFLEFFLLGVLWTLVFINKVKRYIRVTILFGMCIAALDEFIQYFVPGRAMQFTDFLIDVFGVVVGVFVIKGIQLFVDKRTLE